MVAINAERLAERLDAVSRFGATPAGGLDRQALTADEVVARRYVLDVARCRGFACAADALGSLFIRRPGRDPAKPPILCGSHLDSQPKGGRYDGTLGVMAALELLESLEDAGAAHVHPIEAVAWTNEEGSRFAPGAMGSQAYAGAADAAVLLAATDSAGVSVAEAVAKMRDACGPLAERALTAPLAAYLELHIEQGPVLEAEGRSLAVVDGIQGARWLEVRLAGRSGHAGTTPAAMRADAGDAAIRAASAARAAVGGDDNRVRFTIGRIGFQPGSINTIPAEARFSIDLRHPEEAVLDRLEAAVRAAVAAAAPPCVVEVMPLMTVAATRFDPRVTAACAEAVQALGQPPGGMTSGAFHDAQFIARIAPAGMIFIPCRGGVSHSEAEAIEPAHAALGAEALMRAVLALDRRLG